MTEPSRTNYRGSTVAHRVDHAKEWGEIVIQSFTRTVGTGLALPPHQRPAIGSTEWPAPWRRIACALVRGTGFSAWARRAQASGYARPERRPIPPLRQEYTYRDPETCTRTEVEIVLLYPTPTEEMAMAALLPQAIAIWGQDKEEELRKALEPMVKALVALSAFEVPEDTEPLFP